MARSYSKSSGNRVRSDAPFPFKTRRDIEDAQDAERNRRMSGITPYSVDPAKNQAEYNALNDELDAKYKPIYKQELANRKSAKADEANAKAQVQAAKDDEKKRVAGIASGIVRGLAPQRTALIDRLVEYRKSDYEKMKRSLDALKGDIDKLFSGRDKWDKQNAWLTANKDNLEDYLVDKEGNRLPEGTSRYLAEGHRYKLKAEPDTSTWQGTARQQADAIVDEFAAKIVAKTEEQAKIGNSSDEKIVGTPKVESHLDPWQNSRITVETTHRVVTWETNMILNRSKLNTWFNQWPTRLVSDTKK